MNETLATQPSDQHNGKIYHIGYRQYGFWQYFLFSDPPLVRLSFGLNVERERIVEGSDVYMDCLVQAKPKPYKVGTAKLDYIIIYFLHIVFDVWDIFQTEWYLNDVRVDHNLSQGVLVSGTSLVLQR